MKEGVSSEIVVIAYKTRSWNRSLLLPLHDKVFRGMEAGVSSESVVAYYKKRPCNRRLLTQLQNKVFSWDGKRTYF
jgi:hypothetical protein